jgi:hypothetical protein
MEQARQKKQLFARMKTYNRRKNKAAGSAALIRFFNFYYLVSKQCRKGGRKNHSVIPKKSTYY